MTRLLRFLGVLLCCLVSLHVASAQCTSCAANRKTRVGLRLSATFGGYINTKIYVSGNMVAERTLIAGSVVLNPATGRYVIQSYGCSEWTSTLFLDLNIGDKISEEIVIDTQYVTNNTSSLYTDLSPGAPYLIHGLSFPTAKCLAFWIDPGSGEYVRYEFAPLSSVIYNGHIVARMQVKLEPNKDISLEGSSEGPEAGVILTSHQRSDFLDCTEIGYRCSSPRPAGLPDEGAAERQPVKAFESAAALNAAARGGSAEPQAAFWRDDAPFEARGAVQPGPIQEGKVPEGSRFTLTRERGATAASGATVTSAQAKGGVASSPPPPTVAAAPIGAVRLPLDLGGDNGRLIYTAPHFGTDAYGPDRLAFGLESRVVQRVNDGSGRLRQAMLLETFMDVRTISASAMEVRFYAPSKIGAFNSGTGLFPINDDTPSVIWRIDNPDTLPVANRIRFRETRDGVTRTHLATWAAPSGGNSGQLTMSLFDDEIVETREYFLGSIGDANTRSERVVRRGPGAGGPIAASYVETFQEFYHWGQPGEVFESLIERIDDPDGEALSTQYVYYDSVGMPAGAVNGVIYSDGYWEVFSRFGGTGEIAQWYRPYRDGPDTPFNVQPEDCRYVAVNYYSGGPSSQVRVEEEFVLGQGPVARTVLYRDYYSAYGVLVETTNRFLDETAYTQSQTVQSVSSRQVLEDYSTDRTYRQYTSQLGFWNPATETFVYGFAPGVKAKRYFTIEGSLDHPDGVANRTVIRIRVENERGHKVLEEVFVNTGSLPDPAAWTRTDSISRTVRTFDASGRLTTVKLNGNITYEAGYRTDGRLGYEIDGVGVRTDFDYDNFGRTKTRVLTRAAGDPVQTTTFTYDAAGRVRFETRSATKAGVTSTLTREKRYDVAGRLRQEISPDGLTRSIDEELLLDGSGSPLALRTTETSPSGATAIRELYRDRTLYSATGTRFPPRYYLQGTASAGGSTYEVRQAFRDDQFSVLDLETIRDWTGRVRTETRPKFGGGELTRTMTYDGGPSEGGAIRGLLARVDEPGRSPTLMEYDEYGQLTATGVDLNGNGVLDRTGTDPVATTTDAFERANTSAPWFRAIRGFRLLANGSSTATQETEKREQLSQLGAGVVLYRENLTSGGVRSSEQVAVNRATKTATTTRRNLATAGGSQAEVSTEIAGLARSIRRAGATADETFAYDSLGRLETKTNPLSGSFNYAYNALGQLVSTTDSATPARTTTFTYHPNGVAGAGLVATETDFDGKVTRTQYTLQDRVFRQWGRNVYPIEHSYDDEGHPLTVRTFRSQDAQLGGTVDWSSATWPANAPAGDETRYVYDTATGLLTHRRYADYAAADPTPIQTRFTYDLANRLLTRTNARGHVTTYGYDALGRIATQTYSAGSGSTNITQTYDRSGRLASVTDASGTRTLSSTIFDKPDDDTYTSGLLTGLVVNRSYDANNRESGLGVTGVTALTYGYDTLSRFTSVTDNSDATAFLFTYGYQTGNDRLLTLETRRAGTLRLTTTRSYDALGRLSGVTTRDAASTLLQQHAYGFDVLNRRTRVDREDGKSWNFGYNPRGEVTAADKRFADAAGAERLAGWQSTYLFDTAGNRLEVKQGGDAAGANLRTASYTPNRLNQYDQATVPGSAWLTGDALASAVVTAEVDDVAVPVVREGPSGAKEFFAAEWQPTNLGTPAFGNARVKATVAGLAPAGSVGGVWVAKSPETFVYDRDGNLTSDGRWNYTWDADNRLTAIETRPDVVAPAGVLPIERRQRLEFVYDNLSRRIAKKVLRWDPVGSAWATESELRFLYDRWNLLAEYRVVGATLTLLRRHVWGLDLANSLQSAGGNGGLLATKTATAVHAPAFDGNGNAGAYFDLATLGESARFDYDPFGRLLQSVGTAAAELPLRFSTRYEDAETGLLYYTRRYYSPALGRWLSREPLGERESANLYRTVSNSPTNRHDVLGLYEEAGHFYTIYNVARTAGYSPKDAFTLAYYAQLPDEVGPLDACAAYLASQGDPMFEGWVLGSSGTPAIRGYLNGYPIAVNDWGRQIQEVLHSLNGLTGEDLKDRRECLMTLIKDKSLALWQRGMLLHAFGDTYSHVHSELNGDLTAYAYPYGHKEDSVADRVWGGKSHSDPDIIGNFPERYHDYVDALGEGLDLGPTGQGVFPGYRDILKEATYTKLRDHSNDALANELARMTAELSFDYKDTPHPHYAPEKGTEVLSDPDFPTPTPQEVQALLDLVKRRCCLPR